MKILKPPLTMETTQIKWRRATAQHQNTKETVRYYLKKKLLIKLYLINTYLVFFFISQPIRLQEPLIIQLPKSSAKMAIPKPLIGGLSELSFSKCLQDTLPSFPRSPQPLVRKFYIGGKHFPFLLKLTFPPLLPILSENLLQTQMRDQE